MWAVRKSRLRLWIKEEIFWHLSAISRQWLSADRQTLLENFGWIFSSICPENAVPIEIDLAFPGPFDYKNGICLLQGLDKYDALYGCNLRRAFSEISGLPEQRIQFINDAAAFALGK
ncbi:MAG: hypothetical protein ACLRYE_02830 [Gemmiger formicilis]|uniref:hypothetical protein n=1 Tax=Gemmiger formicilis TaxID=745368 RepID=UPI0039A0F8CB